MSAHYLGTSDHVARTSAATGIRLVLDEHRITTTPTERGRDKVSV